MPLILIAAYQFEIEDLRTWASHKKIHASTTERDFLQEMSSHFHRNGTRLLASHMPNEGPSTIHMYFICREGVDDKSSWAGWRNLKERLEYKERKRAFFGEDEEVFDFIKNAPFVTLPDPFWKPR